MIDSIAVNQFNILIKSGIDPNDMSAILDEARVKRFSELLEFVGDSIRSFIKLRMEAELRI